MKKIIILICLTIITSVSFGQKKKGSRGKIKALKTAYITEQLDLSVKEAEKFWPIYNDYDSKKWKLRSEHKKSLKKTLKNEDFANLNEDAAKELVNAKLILDKKLYELEKEFIVQIKQAISYKKIIKLHNAEMEFGRKLMRKYRNERKKFRE